MVKNDLKHVSKRLLRATGRAIGDYKMIENDDRIIVGLSGGKDSLTLLYLLKKLQEKAPVRFELIAFKVLEKNEHPELPALENYCRQLKVEFRYEYARIESILGDIEAKGGLYCAMCARLRRGVIYTKATAWGVNKIALGHHSDDLIETLLMNMFLTGKLKAMAPKLRSDDGRNLLIRPLIYAAEEDIELFSNYLQLPVSDCSCNFSIKSQRKNFKNIIFELQKQFPEMKNSILAALANIHPSHLLDKNLFDFDEL